MAPEEFREELMFLNKISLMGDGFVASILALSLIPKLIKSGDLSERELRFMASLDNRITSSILNSPEDIIRFVRRFRFWKILLAPKEFREFALLKYFSWYLYSLTMQKESCKNINKKIMEYPECLRVASVETIIKGVVDSGLNIKELVKSVLGYKKPLGDSREYSLHLITDGSVDLDDEQWRYDLIPIGGFIDHHLGKIVAEVNAEDNSVNKFSPAVCSLMSQLNDIDINIMSQSIFYIDNYLNRGRDRAFEETVFLYRRYIQGYTVGPNSVKKLGVFDLFTLHRAMDIMLKPNSATTYGHYHFDGIVLPENRVFAKKAFKFAFDMNLEVFLRGTSSSEFFHKYISLVDDIDELSNIISVFLDRRLKVVDEKQSIFILLAIYAATVNLFSLGDRGWIDVCNKGVIFAKESEFCEIDIYPALFYQNCLAYLLHGFSVSYKKKEEIYHSIDQMYFDSYGRKILKRLICRDEEAYRLITNSDSSYPGEEQLRDRGVL